MNKNIDAKSFKEFEKNPTTVKQALDGLMNEAIKKSIIDFEKSLNRKNSKIAELESLTVASKFYIAKILKKLDLDK